MSNETTPETETPTSFILLRLYEGSYVIGKTLGMLQADSGARATGLVLEDPAEISVSADGKGTMQVGFRPVMMFTTETRFLVGNDKVMFDAYPDEKILDAYKQYLLHQKSGLVVAKNSGIQLLN